MQIFEKLNKEDEKFRAFVEAQEEAKEAAAEARRKEEERKLEAKKREKMKIYRDGIQEILEDTSEGIDEPRRYRVIYSCTSGGGYGYGPYEGPSTKTKCIIMTEREKRLAMYTEELYYLLEGNGAYGSRPDEIKRIEEASNDGFRLSNEQKMEMESIKKKVKIINSDEETDKKIVINYNGVQITTSLRQALLASVNINGNFRRRTEEAVEKTAEQAAEQAVEKTAEQAIAPITKTPKISFARIKGALAKLLNRGEK